MLLLSKFIQPVIIIIHSYHSKMSGPQDRFLVENRGRVRVITFNNPRKKNALDKVGYVTLVDLLNAANQDDSVQVLVLTGVGDMYSSGNDISAAMADQDVEPEQRIQESAERIKNFVHAFLNFEKLLIAIVNGPAIGIAATTLPLCDVVFASDKVRMKTAHTQRDKIKESHF